MPRTSKSSERPDERSDLAEIKRHMGSAFRLDRTRHVLKLVGELRKGDSLPTEGPIRLLVARGEVEGRPYDISALAAALGLPRTTVFRHLEEMQVKGILNIRREGRRGLVELTEQGWRQMARNWSKFDPILDDLIFNQIQYLAEDG